MGLAGQSGQRCRGQFCGQFCDRGDYQVGQRGRTVLPPVSEQGEDLDCPVLDGRREVFDRHGRQGRLPEARAQFRPRSGRVADFQAGHGRDPHQPPLYPAGPILTDAPTLPADNAVAVAVAIPAFAPKLPMLTDAECALLSEWLDRPGDSPTTPGATDGPR